MSTRDEFVKSYAPQAIQTGEAFQGSSQENTACAKAGRMDRIIRNPLFFLAMIFTLAVFSMTQTARAELGNVPDKAEVMAKVAGMHLPFVANEGQVGDESVRFYARTFGGTVFVTKDGEVVYYLHDATASVPDAKGAEERPVKGVELREHFIGAKKTGEVRGEDRSQAKVNYFRGKDKEQWRSNIPTYDRVSLGEIYDGIELKLKAYGDNVEKLFYVNPGASPGSIMAGIDGAKALSVNEAGELVVETELGAVRFTRPVAYQEVAAPSSSDGGDAQADNRRYVEVAYSVQENGYGFSVGEYDRSRPLVIDPLLASTFVGVIPAYIPEVKLGIDPSGDIFVAATTGCAFPTTIGAYDTTCNGGKDVAVSKLSGDLTTLLASTYIGGSMDDYAYDLAIDASGNVFVTGPTVSANFPTTAGAYSVINPGTFVLKLSNDLSTLVASTFVGDGYGYYYNPRVLAIDPSGDIVLATTTDCGVIAVTAGAYDTSCNGGGEIYVLKLNSGLTTLLASTMIGGSGYCASPCNRPVRRHRHSRGARSRFSDNSRGI